MDFFHRSSFNDCSFDLFSHRQKFRQSFTSSISGVGTGRAADGRYTLSMPPMDSTSSSVQPAEMMSASVGSKASLQCMQRRRASRWASTPDTCLLYTSDAADDL